MRALLLVVLSVDFDKICSYCAARCCAFMINFACDLSFRSLAISKDRYLSVDKTEDHTKSCFFRVGLGTSQIDESAAMRNVIRSPSRNKIGHNLQAFLLGRRLFGLRISSNNIQLTSNGRLMHPDSRGLRSSRWSLNQLDGFRGSSRLSPLLYQCKSMKKSLSSS